MMNINNTIGSRNNMKIDLAKITHRKDNLKISLSLII
jgi:hypothetical protein